MVMCLIPYVFFSQMDLYVPFLKIHHLVQSPLLLLLLLRISSLKRLQMVWDLFVEAYLSASSDHRSALICCIQLPVR